MDGGNTGEHALPADRHVHKAARRGKARLGEGDDGRLIRLVVRDGAQAAPALAVDTGVVRLRGEARHEQKVALPLVVVDRTDHHGALRLPLGKGDVQTGAVQPLNDLVDGVHAVVLYQRGGVQKGGAVAAQGLPVVGQSGLRLIELGKVYRRSRCVLFLRLFRGRRKPLADAHGFRLVEYGRVNEDCIVLDSVYAVIRFRAVGWAEIALRMRLRIIAELFAQGLGKALCLLLKRRGDLLLGHSGKCQILLQILLHALLHDLIHQGAAGIRVLYPRIEQAAVGKGHLVVPAVVGGDVHQIQPNLGFLQRFAASDDAQQVPARLGLGQLGGGGGKIKLAAVAQLLGGFCLRQRDLLRGKGLRRQDADDHDNGQQER